MGYKWCARYHKNVDNYYVQCNQYINGKHKTVTLHRHIMNYPDGNVDHIEPRNTLDNRKENLRIVDASKNSANRKGANSNNKTGVRNVHRIKGYKVDIYKVQIMKNGISYVWEFPLDQFKEACKFAEKKRKELFGEFAGKS